MPDTKNRRLPRPFWWGAIAFGLVNIPVKLYVANRARDLALRLVSEAGTPLQRRYFCSAEDKPIADDDIIRGFPLEDGTHVTLTEDELAAVAPEKSREIDLKSFVPTEQIAPIYFDKEYLLLPDKGSLKAYRLLARALHAQGRSGIATFVLRDKERLVAISAHKGLLRAETLRFHDELRTPQEIGLPAPASPDAGLEKSLRTAIDRLSEQEPQKKTLKNPYRLRLLQLVEKKLKAGEDVYTAPASVDSENAEADVIDLMQVLKNRLGEKTQRRASSENDGDSGDGALDSRSKAALYRLAQDMEIEGRSRMSKRQLIEAIDRHR